MGAVAVRAAGGQDGHERSALWSALVGTALLALLSGCGKDSDSDEAQPPGDSFTYPALQTEVPLYELQIPEQTLALFAQDPYADEQPATFVADGAAREVKVRLRGSSSRFFPKKSWRIEFPKGAEFDGRRKHNLIAEFQDRTMLTEKLAYDMMLAMGLPVPRTRFVRLSINGQYQGVYLDIERVDQTFAAAHGFVDPDPTIYRCGAKDCEMKLWRTDYQQDWQKETNEADKRQDDIQSLMYAINRAPEPDLPATLEAHLELEHYLRAMVADALISNNIHEDSQSYLIQDTTTGKWTYVPWDLNNNDARWWPTYTLGMSPVVTHPLFGYSLSDGWVARMYARRNTQPGFLPAFSNLNTRIVYNPELRERLLALVERGLDELLAPEVIDPRLDAMYALIAPYMDADPYLLLGPDASMPQDPDGLAKFHEGLPFLKAYARGRTAFVRKELARFRAAPSTLQLRAVNPGEGWVELRNPTGQELSTAGLVVTADLRRTIAPLRQPSTSAVLPERLVPAHGTVRFTPEELGFTLPLEGELGLFDGISVVGALDVLFYGILPPGSTYTRSDEDASRWEIR